MRPWLFVLLLLNAFHMSTWIVLLFDHVWMHMSITRGCTSSQDRRWAAPFTVTGWSCSCTYQHACGRLAQCECMPPHTSDLYVTHIVALSSELSAFTPHPCHLHPAPWAPAPWQQSDGWVQCQRPALATPKHCTLYILAEVLLLWAASCGCASKCPCFHCAAAATIAQCRCIVDARYV